MKSRFAFVIVVILALSAVGHAAQMPDVAKVQEVLAGERDDANAAWWGFDPEDSTMALQAAINSGAPRVIVPNMGADWIVRPIHLRSDLELIFEEGVVVTAKKGEFHGRGESLFSATDVENLIIRGYGAELRMHKDDYDNPALYQKAEWRMGINLRGSRNVQILGLTIKDTGGDGIYLGRGTRMTTNEDVVIRDVVADNNYRQGISVISAKNLLIEDSVFNFTGGTAPSAGIDFEPNHPDELLENIIVRNTVFEGNDGYGILIFPANLDEQSNISIHFEDILIRGGGYGVYFDGVRESGSQATGSVVIRNCLIESTLRDGIRILNNDVNGINLRFEDCTIHMAATHPKSHPIYIMGGRGSGSNRVGGINLENIVVTDDHPRPVLFAEVNPGTPGGGMFNIDGSIEAVNPYGAKMQWSATTHNVAISLEEHDSTVIAYGKFVSHPDYVRPAAHARIAPALRITPICGYLGEELTENPGFEETVSPTRPTVWNASPNWGIAELTTNMARTGEASVKLSGTGFIYQTVPVEGGAIYELTAWVKDDGPSHAAVKIEYWGSEGYLGGEQSDLFGPGDQWRQITTYAQMPDDAKTVTLLLRTYDSEIYFDDASFRQRECLPEG